MVVDFSRLTAPSHICELQAAIPAMYQRRSALFVFTQRGIRGATPTEESHWVANSRSVVRENLCIFHLNEHRFNSCTALQWVKSAAVAAAAVAAAGKDQEMYNCYSPCGYSWRVT